MKRVVRPSPWLVARLGVPVGGRVRMLRALEDRQGREGPRNLDSVLSGSFASPKPPAGGEPEE